MQIRADVAELLHAGLADHTITRELQVDHTTVRAAREALGLPRHKSGRKAAATAEDLFWRRTQPVEGGHHQWTGYRTKDGTPGLRHGGRFYTGYRLAFLIKYGREPEGNALPTCGADHCTAPGHVEDRPMRERSASTFAAIFGTPG